MRSNFIFSLSSLIDFCCSEMFSRREEFSKVRFVILSYRILIDVYLVNISSWTYCFSRSFFSESRISYFSSLIILFFSVTTFSTSSNFVLNFKTSIFRLFSVSLITGLFRACLRSGPPPSVLVSFKSS
jgi:hypothetical protein